MKETNKQQKEMSEMKKAKVPVISGIDSVGPEVLADAIIRLSDAAVKIRESGLNDRAMVTLLQEVTGVKRADITAVLFNLAKLREKFCTR